MTVYLDSSVILRKVLGEPGALAEWGRVRRGVTSALTEVECLRTIDRLRLDHRLPDHEVATRRAAILAVLDALEVVELDDLVLARAAQPLPTRLGTLDAIHLASARLWREQAGAGRTPLHLATHDGALATAARATGLVPLGDVAAPARPRPRRTRAGPPAGPAR